MFHGKGISYEIEGKIYNHDRFSMTKSNQLKLLKKK